MNENNSTRKLGITFYRKPDGTRWVYAELLKYGPPYPKLVISFLDLHRIIQAISECEDERYPPPAKGRTRLAEFLNDAVHEPNFRALAEKYKIPERHGAQIVRTNGAKLRESANTLPHQKIDRSPIVITADEIKWGMR